MKIIDIYGNYVDAVLPDNEEIKNARLMEGDDFLYTLVTICRPLRLVYKDIASTAVKVAEGTKKKADKEYLQEIAKLEWPDKILTDEEVFAVIRKHSKRKPTQTIVKLIRSLGETYPEAPEVFIIPGDKASGFVADPALTDTETIPMKENIDEYIAREVLPFVPDAWRDSSKDKVGCEFPLTRLFYRYTPLRSSEEILADLMSLEADTTNSLRSLISENR